MDRNFESENITDFQIEILDRPFVGANLEVKNAVFGFYTSNWRQEDGVKVEATKFTTLTAKAIYNEGNEITSVETRDEIVSGYSLSRSVKFGGLVLSRISRFNLDIKPDGQSSISLSDISSSVLRDNSDDPNEEDFSLSEIRSVEKLVDCFNTYHDSDPAEK